MDAKTQNANPSMKLGLVRRGYSATGGAEAYLLRLAAELARRGHALDLLVSLERVWSCDLYRAGDGVHAAWLERRAAFEPAWRGFLRHFNPKHRELLELERALLTGGARRIIANSEMVKLEITAHF